MSAGQTEFQRRLYDAAEAFYYAGIIASVPFDAANVHSQCTAADAGIAALGGSNRINYLGAPPIVNLGFSIELYIKLLISLSGEEPSRKEHDICKLFLTLAEISPTTSSNVIALHRYACGCEKEFLEYIRDASGVFVNWRYAHEKDFLISSVDTIFDLANAFRGTIRQTYPNFRSAFDLNRSRENDPAERDVQ